MAEKNNGGMPFVNRESGTMRRGVRATPQFERLRKYDYVESRRQSEYDKQQNINRFLEYRKENSGIGNKDLPAFKHKKEIVSAIEENKVVLLGGPTGSGKSTQTPQFLYETGKYKKIFVLEPRRIVADGLYERLIEELTISLGEEKAQQVVGIAHGERSEHSEEDNIVVVTPNTYLRMEADILEKYGDDNIAVIIDEMHEANLYSELAAASALATVDKNDNWRAIPTSATNDVNLLQENYKEINGGSVPSINIEGRPFNVDIQESPEESVMDVYARIGQEHKTAMIFTRGKQEIEHIIKETKKSLGDEGENVVFRILHADLNDIEARHLTDPVEESQRLVIVATPAGMSGITIPGLTLVITDGTINRPELDRNNVSGIKPDYLSQAEIVQEAGRAGRDISGGIAVVAKPVSVSDDRKRARNEDVLDEEMAYKPINERKSFGPAEIYQSNLAREALTLVGIRKNLWDINDYLNHKVKPSSISNAHESLYRLGAIDIDEQITEMGMKMDSFPIRPELSRGVVEAMSQKRTITHMARIALMAASLDSGGVQEYNSWKVEKGSKPAWSALLRSTTKNDAIAQLDIMTTDMPTEEYPYAEFLYQNELSFKRIKQARKVARKIMRQCGVRLNNIIVPQYMNLKEEQLLLRDLTAGYLDYIHKNAGAKNHKTFFKNIHDSDNNEKRILSRSMVDPSSEYITGSLRWYLKNGTVHNVIEQAFPVEERVVKEYVESDAERLLIPGEKKAIIKDGQVIEEVQYMFGSIAVGAPKITKLEGELPIESQEKLFDYIMNHPGKNLSSIREVAQELEWLSERIPAEELDRNMLRNDIIANQDIQDLVKRLVKTNRLAYMVDDGIRRYMYDNYIDISSYLDDDVRKSFIERSPDVIYVNDEQISIRYENGQPYTTQISQNIKNLSRKGLFLEDGREVLWQIGKGKNKRLVSLASSSD